MKARVITETQLWKIKRYGWCFFYRKTYAGNLMIVLRNYI